MTADRDPPSRLARPCEASERGVREQPTPNRGIPLTKPPSVQSDLCITPFGHVRTCLRSSGELVDHAADRPGSVPLNSPVPRSFPHNAARWSASPTVLFCGRRRRPESRRGGARVARGAAGGHEANQAGPGRGGARAEQAKKRAARGHGDAAAAVGGRRRFESRRVEAEGRLDPLERRLGRARAPHPRPVGGDAARAARHAQGRRRLHRARARVVRLRVDAREGRRDRVVGRERRAPRRDPPEGRPRARDRHQAGGRHPRGERAGAPPGAGGRRLPDAAGRLEPAHARAPRLGVEASAADRAAARVARRRSLVQAAAAGGVVRRPAGRRGRERRRRRRRAGRGAAGRRRRCGRRAEGADGDGVFDGVDGVPDEFGGRGEDGGAAAGAGVCEGGGAARRAGGGAQHVLDPRARAGEGVLVPRAARPAQAARRGHGYHRRGLRRPAGGRGADAQGARDRHGDGPAVRQPARRPARGRLQRQPDRRHRTHPHHGGPYATAARVHHLRVGQCHLRMQRAMLVLRGADDARLRAVAAARGDPEGDRRPHHRRLHGGDIHPPTRPPIPPPPHRPTPLHPPPPR